MTMNYNKIIIKCRTRAITFADIRRVERILKRFDEGIDISKVSGTDIPQPCLCTGFGLDGFETHYIGTVRKSALFTLTVEAIDD